MDKKLIIIGIVAAVVLGSFSSCKKENAFQALRENEIDLRNRYIADNHPGVSPTESGLYYIETGHNTIGNSTKTIEAGDVVQVYYDGFLIAFNDSAQMVTEGLKFDSNGDYEPFSFTVGSGQVIAGWDEAVRLMKEGTIAKIVVPSRLGYGNSPSSPGGAYSTLVFEIEVYKVIKSGEEPEPYVRTDNGPWL